jgi:hypothetical protein
MFYSKILPALLLSVAATLSVPATAQQGDAEDHSAHHPEGSKAQPAPPAKRGGKAMKGGMAGMDGCPMHEDMMGSKGSAERHAMMERRIKSMNPEMRKKYMAKMEKHMQMMQDEMAMMREHMNDQPAGGSDNHDHEHQK